MHQSRDEEPLGVDLLERLGPEGVTEESVPDPNKDTAEVTGEAEEGEEESVGAAVSGTDEEHPTTTLADGVDHIAGNSLFER